MTRSMDRRTRSPSKRKRPLRRPKRLEAARGDKNTHLQWLDCAVASGGTAWSSIPGMHETQHTQEDQTDLAGVHVVVD